MFDGLHWNKDEAEAAEQIALFNMANLYAQQKLSPDLIEGALVEALYCPSSMHLQTSRKILTELIELLKKHTRDYEMDELMQLAAKYSLKAAVPNCDRLLGQHVRRENQVGRGECAEHLHDLCG